MSAYPQRAALADDIDYWFQSDWWPVGLALEQWLPHEPHCLEAKRQALLSACERGQVRWRRTDGKPYDDPIHELAARGRVLIERSSFLAWSANLPRPRRVSTPSLPAWASAQAVPPVFEQPPAGLAVAHIAVVHSRTHAEVVERPAAANDPVPTAAESQMAVVPVAPARPEDDLEACADISAPATPQAASDWTLVAQLQYAAVVSQNSKYDYDSYPSEAELRKLGVPTSEIIDAFKVCADPQENAQWFRERMSNIKRANKGLAAALVQKGLPSRGAQHFHSYWRPDYVAAWLVDKKHMSRQRVIHALQTRFPDWTDMEVYF